MLPQFPVIPNLVATNAIPGAVDSTAPTQPAVPGNPNVGRGTLAFWKRGFFVFGVQGFRDQPRQRMAVDRRRDGTSAALYGTRVHLPSERGARVTKRLAAATAMRWRGGLRP